MSIHLYNHATEPPIVSGFSWWDLCAVCPLGMHSDNAAFTPLPPKSRVWPTGSQTSAEGFSTVTLVGLVMATHLCPSPSFSSCLPIPSTAVREFFQMGNWYMKPHLKSAFGKPSPRQQPFYTEHILKWTDLDRLERTSVGQDRLASSTRNSLCLCCLLHTCHLISYVLALSLDLEFWCFLHPAPILSAVKSSM